ncbi:MULTISPECIES: hypothetical protein [unclassified Variovorax]|jgi:hypothetical protein|uniref:hypothetical protein n=1 Tax=unclassified Variovorax TaxID=663243 RepID=UPI000F7D5D5F|nr:MULTISPECIES: hypothetical protein [unclassified Variovorax]RSZ33825.1 hypothetical protein EJO70_27835 [Variovorax sp. 553]RSZ34178.1 hypothetical protein EJO71_27575 [Variovorax sp. 679]
MSAWRTVAHFVAHPPPAEWRDDLARRIGRRPRRVGLWTELAMYGARCCLDAAGEDSLPPGARIRVSSQRGAWGATHAGLVQLDAGLPMPFTFMQSQPALMLAEVGRCLEWQGDASFALCRDPAQVLRLAKLGAAPDGLLFGIVEEERNGEPARTEWWRLLPA